MQRHKTVRSAHFVIEDEVFLRKKVSHRLLYFYYHLVIGDDIPTIIPVLPHPCVW